MLIYLNTSIEKSTINLLDNDGSLIEKKELSSNSNLTDELTPKIDELLLLRSDSLNGLFINTGENSYTGTRIGMTAINFLGLAFDIQPLEIKKEDEIYFSKSGKFVKPIMPSYKSAPFITTKKSRL
jgi:tRNA A37 threonylcarbamoyladenosine modification protein TsaB